jgi:hypothetical protein
MSLANRSKEMTTAKGRKCAHPVCSCVVASGNYCSPECETMEKTPDIDCACGHPGCKGRTSE